MYFYKIRDEFIVNLDLVKFANYNKSKEELELKFIDNTSATYRNMSNEDYNLFLDSVKVMDCKKQKKVNRVLGQWITNNNNNNNNNNEKGYYSSSGLYVRPGEK